MAPVVMTASEANRSFSKLLRLVSEGREVQVTSHGRTVAVVKPPVDDDQDRQRRQEALDTLRQHWDSTPTRVVGPWTREEIYEERLKRWF